MGWDVFISHASEDKQKVAVPLKQALEQLGMSVWIDIDQIKLGDSFRTAIDWGLQNCRFGVIILSPRFFKKSWTKAELDAFLNKEMSASGQKRLLPVLCDMSFDELAVQSPLLSGRRAVQWKDGLPQVVQAIAEVVMGTPQQLSPMPVQPSQPSVSAMDLQSLVMFLLPDGRMAYAESLESDSNADRTDLTLKCKDASDAALIQQLGRSTSDRVAVAFGSTAIMGQVTEAHLKRTGSKEIGTLNIRNDPSPRYGMEVAFNGFSADKLAEMRARRILLNEKFRWPKSDPGVDAMNQRMLDQFIAGQGGFLKLTESPIPKLYAQFSGQPDLFVALARLASVMFLCLSNTVEQILRLDMHLEGKGLHVDFAGQRAKVYSNVDPPMIEVKGTLHLK